MSDGRKNNGGAREGAGAPIAVDRELSKEVRRLTLNKIKDILEQPIVKMKTDDYELYKAILVKLAGSVLPRLNEHTGDDGEPLMITVNRYEDKDDKTS